jgi:hypothetical protein
MPCRRTAVKNIQERCLKIKAVFSLVCKTGLFQKNRKYSILITKRITDGNWETDAAHIAITTVNGLDFIVSLNFNHIVRPWTIERVRRVNKREGYQGIGIYKPAEVLEL